MSAPAPPLVLLHGWGLSPTVWDALRNELRAGLDPATPVLTPALPGHAGAAATASATLDAWADAVAAQIPPGATVVGWSLGGMLALALATRHPTRVARLALLASTARFVALDAAPAAGSVPDRGTDPSHPAPAAGSVPDRGTDPNRARFDVLAAAPAAGSVPDRGTDPNRARTDPRHPSRADAWPGLAAATVEAFCCGFATDPAATLKRFIALQCLGEPGRKALQDRLARYLANPAAADLAALAQGLDILARSDLRAALARIPQPCLIVHGAHDALMPSEAAWALAAQLANARVHVLPACGHALPLSQTAACARLINEFIA